MLGKVIQGLVKSAIKNAVNFELAIDPLIAGLEKSCPPRETIDKILTQKNQLTQALTQTQTALTTITDTSSTIDTVLTRVNRAVQVIKLLPIPSAVPPGIGIPLNVINGFSSALDALGTIIKEGKGTVKQVTPAVKIISGNITNIQSKLSQLDNLIAGCLIEQVNNDLLWSSTKTYITGDPVSVTNAEGGKDYYISTQDNVDKLPSQNPSIWEESNENDAKEKYFSKLGINLNTEDVDEGTLSANSNDPLTYKGFTITLDTNAGNKFSFPQRRAIAINEKTGQKLTGPFSYSSSTQVLIDAIKFEIDKITKPTLADATNDIAASPVPADPTPPPSTSGTAGTAGTAGTSGTSSTPPINYTPFDGPGTVSGEVRLKGGKYFKYLSQQQKWVDHTINLNPVGRKGVYDGEEYILRNNPPEPYPRSTYKWSDLFYTWMYQGTQTGAV